MEIYQQKVADFSARFESSSDYLKAIIQECDNVSSDTPIHIVDAIRQSLLHKFDTFKKFLQSLASFFIANGYRRQYLRESNRVHQVYNHKCKC